MGRRLAQDAFQGIGLSCSNFDHFWLFDLFKISSRLGPESKFMFFRVCYSRFATDWNQKRITFLRVSVKICSVLKPETIKQVN